MVESNIFEYLPRDILELSAKENSSDFEDINHEDELIDYYYQEEECENVNENYNDQNYVKVIIANSNESNNEEKNTEYNICGAVHGNYRRAFAGGNSNAVWGAAHFADLCRSAVRLCFGH